MTPFLKLDYKPQSISFQTKLLIWIGISVLAVLVEFIVASLFFRSVLQNPGLYRLSILLTVIATPLLTLFIVMSTFKTAKANKYIHVDSNGFQFIDYTMVPWNIVTHVELVNGLLLIEVIPSELPRYRDKDSVMIYRDKLALNMKEYELGVSEHEFIRNIQSFRAQSISEPN